MRFSAVQMIDVWNRVDVPADNVPWPATVVVDDDVEVTEPLSGGIDERGDGVGVPHVGGHELGVTTLRRTGWREGPGGRRSWRRPPGPGTLR